MLNILLFLFVFAVLYLKACLMSGGPGGEIIVLYLGHLVRGMRQVVLVLLELLEVLIVKLWSIKLPKKVLGQKLFLPSQLGSRASCSSLEEVEALQ